MLLLRDAIVLDDDLDEGGHDFIIRGDDDITALDDVDYVVIELEVLLREVRHDWIICG